ncbi:MAG TPA: metallophosphoesterase [Myxococcales bacterium]|jgi:hypothetical protein
MSSRLVLGSSLTLVLLAAAALLGGCPGDAAQHEGPDADQVVDGSVDAEDSGAGRDTGPAGRADAAQPAKDAGARPDAATPAPDAGTPAADAGTPAASFQFVVWGDTKTGTNTLAALSKQVKVLNVPFTLFGGDLETAGFTQAGMNAWKNAIDGDTSGATSNGLFDTVFPVRGNHDSSNASGWQAYWDLRSHATSVGATHYSEQTAERTWSFDYGNAHFVGVDVPGDVTLMTAAEVTWIDQDLTAAEARGVTHSFLMWHGPLWTIAEHCCTATKPQVIDVFNKHPSVSATFHGHEHVHAWVHMNQARYSNLTHEFEELVAARAGAEPATCRSGRTDYCQDQQNGFLLVEVDGRSFSVSFFEQGNTTPVKQMTFTKP